MMPEKGSNRLRDDMITYLRGRIEAAAKEPGGRIPESFLRAIKQGLVSLKIYSPLSDFLNRTAVYLQKGYVPRDFWGRWGRHFLTQKYRHQILPSHHWILDQIKSFFPARVLEVGSGFGRTTSFLASQMPEKIHWFGMDVSLPMLAYGAQKHRAGNLKFLGGDMVDLPFQSGQRCSQAKVRAQAEGQVFVRLAGDVQGIGIGKLPFGRGAPAVPACRCRSG